MASKTLAEEAAWRFAKDNTIDLVVLNPGFVIGPLLQPALNSTSQMILAVIKGTFFNLLRMMYLNILSYLNCLEEKFFICFIFVPKTF